MIHDQINKVQSSGFKVHHIFPPVDHLAVVNEISAPLLDLAPSLHRRFSLRSRYTYGWLFLRVGRFSHQEIAPVLVLGVTAANLKGVESLQWTL
jgi:hypothetical protein